MTPAAIAPTSRRTPPAFRIACAFLAITLCGFTSAHPWKQRVSAQARARTNPLPASPDTVAAGAHVYKDHCASCHGLAGEGRGRRPALQSADVQTASDGELMWMLENGSVWHGMPSWSSLPEPQRWQIIRFLRTLPTPPQTTVSQPVSQPRPNP